MRRFLVGLLATIGALVLLVAAGVGLALWWWLPADRPDLPERMVLTVDLREGLPAAPPPAPIALLGLPAPLTLPEFILAIEEAADDPRVGGLVARLDGDSPGLAQGQEIRDALARFRAADKFAFAYADSFGEFGPGTLGYVLASGFDEIHLQPLGGLGLTGLVLETPLVRGFLEELGIEPEGGRRGPYKTLYDTLALPRFTDEHLAQLNWLADSLYDQVVEGIAETRGLAPAAVRELIDDGPYSADEALGAGLVDALSYGDQVMERALERAGADEEVPLARYASALPEAEAERVAALIQGVGTIQVGDSDAGPTGQLVMGADTIAQAFEAAIDDPEVDAILFQVESGGGSAVASEAIGHAVRRATEAGKPVIASLGEVAASGGYWVVMDTTAIVARPGTVTGSIGVLAGKPVLAELWRNLEVEWSEVERGANATMWSLNSGYSARGKARLDAFLDRIYDAFVDGVARGRGLTREAVLEVAEGRVWTGAQALEHGLVDGLGGFTEALERTRQALGAAEGEAIELRRFPRPRPPWQEALDLLADPFGLRAWLEGSVWRSGTLLAPPLVIR